jgi:hypothetical protein
MLTGEVIWIETTLESRSAQPVREHNQTITPLEEQQMFDDWCPYKGNPDPRTVWAAAIDAVNGMLLGAQPVRDDEFKTRGELAARLKCWHRLTREESDELVDLMRAQPGRERLVPLTDDQIQGIYRRTYKKGHHGRDFENLFARGIEAAHGIGGDK